MKLFIWKIINNGLLFNAERKKRGLTDQGDCPRCDEEDETLDHIFRRCKLITDCWAAARTPWDFNANSHAPLVKWIEDHCHIKKRNQEECKWRTTFPYMLWNIWKARNALIFNNVQMTAEEISNRAYREAMEAQSILLKHQGLLQAKQLWVTWLPSPKGVVKVNTDGSRSSITDMASVGGVFRDHNGLWVAGFYTKIGNTTSFAAELWGLREVLKIAVNWGFSKLLAETDSKSIIQALESDDCSSTTEVLISDCMHLINQLNGFELVHIFREGN